jgi:hypothetical protein
MKKSYASEPAGVVAAGCLTKRGDDQWLDPTMAWATMRRPALPSLRVTELNVNEEGLIFCSGRESETRFRIVDTGGRISNTPDAEIDGVPFTAASIW